MVRFELRSLVSEATIVPTVPQEALTDSVQMFVWPVGCFQVRHRACSGSAERQREQPDEGQVHRHQRQDHRRREVSGGPCLVINLFFFVVLVWHKPVLGGFDWHINHLSTVLSSAVNKSQQCRVKSSWERPKSNLGCWVGTKYASSVLCTPVSLVQLRGRCYFKSRLFSFLHLAHLFPCLRWRS